MSDTKVASRPYIIGPTSSFFVVPTTAPFIGPANAVGADPAIWWGLRSYSTAKAATAPYPAIDIVDSGGINPATINILSTGDLDMSTLNAWIVAHGTAFVTKLYDHVGTVHLTQATVANMPVIAVSPSGLTTGRPSFYTDPIGGRTCWMQTASFPNFGQPYTTSTAFNCQQTTAAFSQIQWFVDSRGGGGLDGGNLPGGPVAPVTMNFSAGISLAIATWYSLTCVGNSTSGDINANGTVNTQDTGTTAYDTGGFALFNHFIHTSPVQGWTLEFGFWTSAFSGAQSSAIYSNRRSYWGF